jgi:hypothetical protein
VRNDDHRHWSGPCAVGRPHPAIADCTVIYCHHRPKPAEVATEQTDEFLARVRDYRDPVTLGDAQG